MGPFVSRGGHAATLWGAGAATPAFKPFFMSVVPTSGPLNAAPGTGSTRCRQAMRAAICLALTGTALDRDWRGESITHNYDALTR